jgi:hypothetical protein
MQNKMIIDSADDTTDQIVHLEADVVSTAIRYLTTNTDSFKLIKPPEARVLAAAGIRLGLVYETGGGAPGQAPLTAAQGQIDGAFAAQYAPTVGAPTGACIYFAADNDFSAVQIQSEILPYFAAVAKAMAGSGFVVGVYGSGNVCQAVCAAGSASLAWLSGSLGWGGSRAYLAAKPKELVLVQDVEDTKLANLDEAIVAKIGIVTLLSLPPHLLAIVATINAAQTPPAASRSRPQHRRKVADWH